jgi:putative protease
MFNATSQSAAKLIPSFKEWGLTEFRFEALYEEGRELKDKINFYAEIIRENSKHFYDEALMAKLGGLEKYGLSDKAFGNRKHKNRKV